MGGADEADGLGTSDSPDARATLLGRATGLGLVLCLIGAAIGALGLLGWIAGARFLTTLIPGEPQMKANTALSLFLLGVGGALRRRAAGPRAAVLLATIAALIALAIGVGTAWEYAAGRDLGIDQLLFEEASPRYPGRPSPPTAIAIALLAGGLLLLDSRPRARARPAEWMILGAGLIGFAAIVGAAFGAGPLYRMRTAPVTGVAVPTALGLLLLSAGMFLERPAAGIARLATSPAPGGMLLRRLVLPGVALPVLLGFGLSRGFALAGIQDVALLYASLVALTTVLGLAFLASSAAPLDRMYEALAASRAQTRELIEQAPDGIFVADLEGRYTAVNRAGCEMLGLSREEIVGKTILDLIPPEDVGRLAASKQRLLAGSAEKAEWRLLRKDATYLPVELNAKILLDGRWQAFVRDISERKRAEEALRRSELKFRRLVEAIPDGVIINQAGRIVYTNGSFVDLLGYNDQQEILGRPIFDILSPGDHEIVQSRIRYIQDTGKMARPEQVTMLRRDGTPVVVESIGIGVEIEGALAIVVVFRDLTDRLRAEEALRFSEAKFSGMVSISADAIISIDEQQKITVFNAGAENIFGYSRDEVLGAPLDLLLSERFRERHREHVAQFSAGQVAARRMGERFVSITGRRKNGQEFPAEASISNLRIGNTKLLTVVLRDVTARERLEREQRMLADMGVVLAGTLDYEQTLASVARIAATDFADWCMVEVMEAPEGVRRVKVVSGDATKAAVAARLEHLELERRWSYLARPAVDRRQPWLVSRLTGADVEAAAQSPEHLQALRALRPASSLSVPLMLRDQVLGALTFISSNPARSYGAGDLRLANAIAERASLAIENARLYRAALTATTMRDQVLGVVAHDLRNPLNVISLHASALKRSGPERERREQRHKDAIERAARRMNRLIQDLLDVAVLEAGHLRVQRAALSANELVAEAVDMQRALAAASAIDLRVDAAPDVPPILGDHERLLQVFENLLGNALKFTEAGGRITIGMAPGESSALFWVADTGRGMSPEELTRVFDRFWQASARSGRLGAGLGLPITKGIVESHGGRIWVESAPGQGSTFFFSIPFAAPRVVTSADVVH